MERRLNSAAASVEASNWRDIFDHIGKPNHRSNRGIGRLTTFLTMAYIIFVQPAVLSGAAMCQNVRKIDWSDYSESVPSLLIMVGIPLCYSIADGLALGFISYPIIKFFSGRGKEIGAFSFAPVSPSGNPSSLRHKRTVTFFASATLPRVVPRLWDLVASAYSPPLTGHWGRHCSGFWLRVLSFRWWKESGADLRIADI
ncbi:Permease-like protein [Pedosphaera parvula Ellin514]|uniref:Permease-like protein n=1 Tax=Pedosphaera parvula (strain Ellin514) TaxID=320771 RepID=B9XKZ8_PEDPL|nr:Permease-like protein [Pedosphaera parvula Ellin514]